MHGKKTRRQRGSALVVVMLVIFMLMLLGVTVTSISTTRSQSATESSKRVSAEAIAEAGVGVMLDQVEASSGNDLTPVTVTTSDGSVTVTATDLGQAVVRLDAQAETRDRISQGSGVKFRVEAHLQSSFHPAFFKAIYVGNKQGLDVDLVLGPGDQGNSDPGTQSTQSNWETLWEDDADYVEGDVWANGKVKLKGDTRVFGSLDSTDKVDGKNVKDTGDINEKVAPVPPPDLAAMDYENRPETVVLDDPSNIPPALQDVFFPGKDKDDSFYSGAAGLQAQNKIFHLGVNGGGSSTIGFDETDNGKIFYIKGNLWIHSSSHKTMNLPDNKDIQVTIVVEGNLYVSDDLNYGEDTSTGLLTNSGVLFIAKGSDANPETFYDANMNYKYDGPQAGPDGTLGTADDILGETIINDQGVVGVYEGPATGQGNVYFGDAVYGTGGVTHGYMYAQNNAYITDPVDSSAVTQDWHKIYGVYGFLSAGGVFDTGDRTKATDYRNYKVKYDDRIENGTLNLPGIPKGSGGEFAGLRVVSWRVLPPN